MIVNLVYGKNNLEHELVRPKVTLSVIVTEPKEMKVGDLMAKEIEISTEYIPLGQFLKLAEIIQTGGMAKWFLSEHEIYVNGEPENRRGKKLRNNDIIDIPGFGTFIVKA